MDGVAALTIGPRRVERPADRGITLVAGLGGSPPAMVDGGGAIGLVGAGWSVDWWIGADDRWYVPAREPSVRQRRIGHGPIIETSVRIPGGTAALTTYPVLVGRETVTAVEVRNDSPVPVALGIAIRPVSIADTRGDERALSIDWDRKRVVRIDGRPAVSLPRPPNEAGASADRDLFAAVQAGASLSWEEPVNGPTANAVCLYPLPHGTSLRFAIVEGGTVDAPAVDVGALPDPEPVARGWTSVIEAAGRFEFPDPGVTALAGAARARLVIAAPQLPDDVVEGAPGAGVVLEGLAAGGHRTECTAALIAFAESFPTRLPHGPIAAAEILGGVALASALVDRPDLVERLLEPAAQLAHLIERSGDQPAVASALTALAALTEMAGQHDAADGIRGRVGSDATREITLEALTQSIEAAAPAARWGPADSAEAAARFWLAARSTLIARPDPLGGGGHEVDLLPRFPTAWRGGEVEVHEAAVAGRRLSFAVRWHGYRPALLWDSAPGPDPAPPPLRLRCSGLDPDWSSDEPRGETLLAGTAEDLPDAPVAGDSFT